MARPDPFAERQHRHGLGRYLLDGERIVSAAHQHWAKVALPVLSVVAGLVLVLVLDSLLPPSLSLFDNLLWWAWFILIGQAAWKVLRWRNDWFVVTDKRLILTYGLITQQVAMMPLVKVTDMSYNRSPLGRLLGYGTFVMESAGQDQALHQVRWVDRPDQTYRAICTDIFELDDEPMFRNNDDPLHEDDPPSRARDRYARFVTAPNGPAESDDLTGITTRPAPSKQDEGDLWHPDSSAPDSDFRQADTGPIPYRPPSTEDSGH
jgi:membrane protein YdbS with pleckstrin-like domain